MHWMPSNYASSVFTSDPMRKALQEEAAISLQRFWRCTMGTASSDESVPDEDASQDEGSGDPTDGSNTDDNSTEMVAVRRAFMTSTASSGRTTSSNDAGGEFWSFEQILAWHGTALDLALVPEDRRVGVKVYWREWAKIEHRVPSNLRRDIVKSTDAKLASRGFPSLREIVAD
eukprot:gnl/TRDRNA2_/TRDRNA2_53683_c0_seq1.p1 gnl/TRDRNA2_/TRDRNA2_53683_c0~~gnl/TRDRNA2_/TRDRNA2_53683_c0_seq1.p1  ORF type:complete len:173 (+),score=9.57 gnl/TRDRNA2_/TRDRNA2_53683_c0_seq1:1-519(+)